MPIASQLKACLPRQLVLRILVRIIILGGGRAHRYFLLSLCPIRGRQRRARAL